MEPPAGSKPGDRVTAAGFGSEAVAVLKKDAFDSIAASLATDATYVACFDGVPLETGHGLCTVRSIANGAVK